MYSASAKLNVKKTNSVNFAKIIFLVSYCIYLFLYIDSLLLEPVIGLNKYFSYIYPALWISVALITSRRIIIDRKNSVLLIIISLYAYYLIAALFTNFSVMNYAMPDELRACLKFVSIIGINIYFINHYNMLNEFIGCSYYVCGLFLLIRYFMYGAPLQGLQNISNIMSTHERYRESFGLFTVNSTGNLSAATFIISILFMAISYKEKNLTILKICSVLLLDAFVFLVLISTGSRNSIIQVILFFLIYEYFSTMRLNQWNNKSRRMLRFFVFIIAVFVIIYGFRDFIVDLFVSSLRFKSFQIDIPTFIKSKRVIQGMGLFNVGLFSRSQTLYGATVNVDNYYLYVLLETGILGFVFIIATLIKILLKLLKIKEEYSNVYFKLVLSTYIVLLLAGLGESCVVHYVFPSSMMFLTIVLTTIKIYYRNE